MNLNRPLKRSAGCLAERSRARIRTRFSWGTCKLAGIVTCVHARALVRRRRGVRRRREFLSVLACHSRGRAFHDEYAVCALTTTRLICDRVVPNNSQPSLMVHDKTPLLRFIRGSSARTGSAGNNSSGECELATRLLRLTSLSI